MSEQSTGYWAFAANPRIYRIADAVRELDIDWWTARRAGIRRGDRVAIWKHRATDPDRGIVALGEVLDDPQPRADTDNPYWIAPPAPTDIEMRVPVRYITAPNLPLWVDGPNHQLLAGLSVARAQGGTNFHLTPEQWDAIVEAAGGWPADQPDPGLLATAERDIGAFEAEEAYEEGARSQVLSNRYERDPRARAEAIRIHGTSCQVCGFSFEAVYGPRGKDYVEVHHLKPLSSYGGTAPVNPATDTASLCANCHRMIDRDPAHPLTLDELRALTASPRT